MEIIFIQTGGTIDKDYPRKSGGWAFEFGEPATKRILENLDPSFPYEVLTACQKDSQELTDQDRTLLTDVIQKQQAEKIIITHGTDTIIETAKYLSERIEGKLIILTGAMRPERFSNSDAPINLGSAIGFVNSAEKGVFICMHGIVKPFDKVKRNPETGQFI